MLQKICGMHKTLVILCACLLLISCATEKPAPHLTQQSAQTFLHSAWQAQGMLSYRAGQKGFSAAYVWQNQTNQYTVQVIAPLGTWHAKLLVQPHQTATLKTSDGKIFHADNPLLLMEENLDWSMPVEDLRYWLGGIPAPNQAFSLRQTPAHDIAHISQADWSIDYLGYQNFSSLRLPKKIILTHANKTITLLIEQFKALPT